MKKLLVTFMVALFATVVFGQTRNEVKTADLPKCVSDWVVKNMKGSTIDKAFKIDSKNEISYVVRLVKGKDKRWMEFGKNCGSVTKVAGDPEKTEAVPAAPPKPVPLPPVKKEGQPTPAPKK